MSDARGKRSYGYRETLISAVSAGCFFILVGAILATTPHLLSSIIDFFKDFNVVQVPKTDLYLPAPVHPSSYSTVYSAVAEFSLIWGVLQIAFLAARFLIRSPLRRKAQSASDVVFWLGTSYLVGVFLNEKTTSALWFAFWASIIALLGLTLIVRAIVLAAGR